MDFNFFEQYNAKKGKTNIISLIIVSISTAAVGIILIMILSLFIQINGLKSNIKKHNKLMEEEQFKSSLVKVTELQGQLSQVQGENTAMEFYRELSDANHTVKREVLDGLTSQLVAGVSMSTFQVIGDEVTLGGSFRSLHEIAQFEYNVRSSDMFEVLYVEKAFAADGDVIQVLGHGNIVKVPMKDVGIDYSYMIKLKIKDGIPSEEN